MESYDVGDVVSIRTYSAAGEGFKDEDGMLNDPSTVTLMIREPDGTETTYTYALDQVAKEAVGRYAKEFSPDQSGVHHYRWVGTGAVAAAFEGAFFVRESRF